MFSSLKNKLKKFLGKPEEEVQEESEEKISPKKGKTKLPTNEKESKKTKKKLPSDKELKKQAEKIPDSQEVPKEFHIGTLKVEPDLEEIQESFQEIKEPETPKEEKKSFFSKLKSKITTSTLDEDTFKEIFQELEIILLENNVALEVVDKIKENLSKDLIGIEIKKGQIENAITTSLKEAISEVLIEPPDIVQEIKKSLGPYTIVFFGINGTGKTTSIAKLAHLLKKENISCVLAAGDTFRAASIEQLQIHADKLKVPLIKQTYGSDPTAVAFDAKKYAEKNNIQCVLIDTAGRMYTKENLIKQMEKLIRVIKPNKKIFVGESIAGNDSIEQVKTFNEAIGIDGIILSKADVDEKAGTILSVSYVTNKPIYFLGIGQEYKDLQPFNKNNILKNLGLD